MFAKTSRYAAILTAVHTAANKHEIPYVTLRELPTTKGFFTHAVVQGDRLDKIAATYLGDPELFWHVCDANPTLLPDDLLAELSDGTRRRLTMPAGTR